MEEVKVVYNSNRLKFTRGTHLLARGFTSEDVAEVNVFYDESTQTY
jgi:hypothetical protein